MSNRMLEQLSKSDPAGDGGIDESFVAAQLASILDADGTTAPEGTPQTGTDRSPKRVYWRVAGAVAGLSVAAAVWFGVVGSGSSPSQDSAFAASLIRIAEDNPRLLITERDWSLTDANEFGRAYGELDFSNGVDELLIRWAPANDYRSTYEDRLLNSQPQLVELPVGAAAVFGEGGSDYTALLAPSDGTYVEIRGDLGDFEQFVSILQSVRSTDVDSWLSALPENVVTLANRSAEVDDMLNGTPLPTDFDVGALKRDAGLVIAPNQLRYLLSTSVACAWLDQWKGRSGNAGSSAEARDVLDTAASWPVVAGMRQSGIDNILDWTEDGFGGSGSGPNTDPGYRQGLGCAG